MTFDWKSVVGTVAPTLATALGGPLAGLATKAIINAVGLPEGSTDEQLETAIRGATPDQLLAIKNADNTFKLEMKKLEVNLEELKIKDVTSARERDVRLAQSGYRNNRANTMYILAVAIIVGLGYAIWYDETLNEYVKGTFTLVLGRFLGYLDAIYNFEFGKTRGSDSKDETIRNLSKNGAG